MNARGTRRPRGRGGLRPPTSGHGRSTRRASGCGFGVVAVAAGTVLAAAGVVAQQGGSGLRSTALLVALVALYVGGNHARTIIARAARRGQPRPTPGDPFPTPWPPPGPQHIPNVRQAGPHPAGLR